MLYKLLKLILFNLDLLLQRAINAAGGIEALSALLRQAADALVREEVTAVLWNLSSSDVSFHQLFNHFTVMDFVALLFNPLSLKFCLYTT